MMPWQIITDDVEKASGIRPDEAWGSADLAIGVSFCIVVDGAEITASCKSLLGSPTRYIDGPFNDLNAAKRACESHASAIRLLAKIMEKPMT